MKKLAIIMAVAAIAASATGVYAGQKARSGVNGSVHDMNYMQAAYAGIAKDNFERVCVFCHTPHSATMGTDDYPLWNHNLTGVAAWTNFAWSNPVNAANLLVGDPLTGPSRLCMSCHDGATAIDEHNSNYAQAGSVVLAGAKAVGAGGDLTNDHPIGFSYDDAVTFRNVGGAQEVVAKTESFATAIALSADNTYNTVTRAGSRKIQDVLYNGVTMTCASCHEVHNKENAIQDAGIDLSTPNYLLYAKEKDSLICLSCHIK